ncbi:MAG: hypothetical protein KJ065_22195 [Anaerolineae bacterium]|nr:hypothetical protein [Anaerolineae bacterium]
MPWLRLHPVNRAAQAESVPHSEHRVLSTEHHFPYHASHIIFLLAIICLCFAIPVHAQPDADTTNPFGIVEGFWLPDAACEIGAGWERIIFDWAEHQPDGPEDWNTLNVDARSLEAARECNREVVGIVKHTPQWATDGLVNAGVSRGLYLPIDDPGNLWANFMRRAAAYYAPLGVRRWIIWNEPDITRDTYGFEFEGTVEDYAQLVKVAYLATKEGNPDAIVHLAGTTYWHDVNAGRRLYLDRLLEVLTADPDAAANDTYFDAITLHIYYRTDTVWQIVREMQAVLDSYGLHDKHIWIGETNASPNLDPLWPVERPNWQITLDQQSAFLVQATALGLAAGADHIGVYKFYDWNLTPGAESFGLIRVDETRRPAFTAWQMIAEQFSGVTGGKVVQTETVDVVRLDAGAQQIVVAWARSGLPVQIRIGATDAEGQIGDQYGMMMRVRPLDGSYSVALPGALCNETDGCPVGGAPVILVQSAGEVNVQELTPSGVVDLQFD